MNRRVAELASTLIDRLSAYLPLLLMGLLALGSWWLVRQLPQPEAPRAAAVLRHVPDYSMRDFTVQRFAADGRLRGRIEGELLHHYPDTDTLEIEKPHIRAYAPGGATTEATAHRAISSGDGSQVVLSGGAHVVRSATADQPAADFRGESLQADFQRQQLRSEQPVTVVRGGMTMRADAFEYDHARGNVELKGSVRGVFQPSR